MDQSFNELSMNCLAESYSVFVCRQRIRVSAFKFKEKKKTYKTYVFIYNGYDTGGVVNNVLKPGLTRSVQPVEPGTG